MSEPLIHPPGVRVCRPCPIGSCDWHHDEVGDRFDVPALVVPDAEMLAKFDGNYQSAAITATMLADLLVVEAALVKHFTEDHTLLDWAAEVVRLNAEANRLVALGCQCTCHVPHPAEGCAP